MLKSVVASSAIFLSLAASYSNAYSLITSKTHTGIIASVNEAEKSMVVIENSSTKTFFLSQNAKVLSANGQQVTLHHLQKGQSVQLKETISTPFTAEIKGEVLDINPNSNQVKLQTGISGKVITLQLDENTRFSGSEVSSLSNIKRGNTVVVTTK
jgi:RNase P/RNase MRP subunit p29